MVANSQASLVVEYCIYQPHKPKSYSANARKLEEYIPMVSVYWKKIPSFLLSFFTFPFIFFIFKKVSIISSHPVAKY